jgi:rubrerythrin
VTKVESVSSETINNLLAAYISERNASARYIAFAVQADKEGFRGVGSLFRAVAHSEQVHATNHARVLRKYGAELDLSVYPFEVKTTAENLRAAINGEEDERDQVYPAYLDQAQREFCTAAQEVFDLALEAEAVHAMMFMTALDGLEDYRQRSTYYVCMVCGWVCTGVNFRHCVLCNSAKDRFERVD